MGEERKLIEAALAENGGKVSGPLELRQSWECLQRRSTPRSTGSRSIGGASSGTETCTVSGERAKYEIPRLLYDCS